MDSDLTRLTVFFEAPFWVGVFERFEGETLSVYQKQDGDTVRIAIKKQDGKPAVLAAVRFTA